MAVAIAIAALTMVTDAGASLSSRVATVQRAARRPEGSTALGAASATATQSGIVVLKPKNAAALKKFVTGVTTRGSSTYHQYLRAGQFAAKFGPAKGTIDAVKSQLTNDGLKIKSVSKNGLLIDFTGSTPKVEAAFSTRLERYRTAAGVTGEQATKAIKLPSSISADVRAVIGLNTLIHPEANYVRAPKAAFAGRSAAKTADITKYPAGSPKPCTDATTDANDYGGLTDDQIANAYGAFGEYSAGDTGAGVHIGVYELEPFEMADLKTFDSCYFGASAAASMASNVTVTKVDGGQPTGPGSGESILDVEDVSAIAPGADINVYEAPNSTAGALDEYGQMVDDDADQIISSSWGECEQDVEEFSPGVQQAENYIFEQAAAQGQTVLSAAGDAGDDTCNEIESTPPPTDQNPLSVDDPSSQPYVLAVGGTTLQDADPAHYDETVWNDGANWGGGGGGISQTWSAPSWQLDTAGFPTPTGANDTDYTNANAVEANAKTTGLSENAWPTGFCANNATADYAAGTPCRALPDVTADGDEFTGAITIYSQSFGPGAEGWITIGGTSSATPIWAAMLALVDSSSSCKSNGVTDGIGFAAPLLYAVADNPTEYAESFHDITVGNNDVYGLDDGKVFPATTGYDLASGLGSPLLTGAGGTVGLAANLCDLASTTTVIHPTITSLDPSAGSVTGGSVTVNGSGFEPVGGATVEAVTVGSYVLPTADWHVTGDSSISVTLPKATATLASNAQGGSTGTQDGAGPDNIVVTMSNGVSSAITPDSEYDYVDKTGAATTPSVTAVAPYAGLESAPSQITIYGSGFTQTGDSITVGGVATTGSYTYVSPWEIKVTPPTYSDSHTDCTTAAAITAETAALKQNDGNGDTDPAADDICQTNVVVTNSSEDASTTQTPLPTYEGPTPTTDQNGFAIVPAGYELSPTSTEYDYLPTPTITGVSTTTPDTYADAFGGTVVTLTGTGLNPLTLNWIDIGDAAKEVSEDIDTDFYSGTSLEVEAPPDTTTGDVGAEPKTLAVSVNTMAGQSAAGARATYAGLPKVTSVSTGHTDPIAGLPTAVDTGGTALTINGSGFVDATGPLQYTDSFTPYSNATQHTYTVASDTQINTQTLSENPAIVDAEVCTVSGCSIPTELQRKPAGDDQFLVYPPGKPVISSIATEGGTNSGPADGGTAVEITGENLGCVTGVYFGSKPALLVAPTEAILDCGSTTSLTVVAPKGTVGKSVTIKLTTVQSDEQEPAGFFADSPTKFKYTANPRIDPARLKFGSEQIGSKSAAKIVTIHNPGPEPLILGKPIFTGKDPGQFKIDKDKCAKVTVRAGGKCTLEVRFAPIGKGSRAAALDIAWNYAAQDLRVSLTGNGSVKATKK